MKKLLVSVLAAGLVLPSTTALAQERIVAQNGEITAVDKSTSGNTIANLGSADLNKELAATVAAEAKAKADAAAAAEKAKADAAADKQFSAQVGGVNLTPTTTTVAGQKPGATTPTTTAPTTTAQNNVKLANAYAKASSEAKTAKPGAKKLPKTSAAK